MRWRGNPKFPPCTANLGADMGLSEQKLVLDLVAWAGNVSSSVLIIFVNKVLMNTTGYGFQYGTHPVPLCILYDWQCMHMRNPLDGSPLKWRGNAPDLMSVITALKTPNALSILRRRKMAQEMFVNIGATSVRSVLLKGNSSTSETRVLLQPQLCALCTTWPALSASGRHRPWVVSRKSLSPFLVCTHLRCATFLV